jgi:hypothetical protein
MGAAHYTLPKFGGAHKSWFTQGNNHFETSSLVWLDDVVNDTKEYIDAKHRLRKSMNHLKIFKDARKCKNHIKSMSKDERIVLIVNDRLGQQVVSRVHQFRQVSSIYVYITDPKNNGEWTKEFTKVNKIGLSLMAEFSFRISDQRCCRAVGRTCEPNSIGSSEKKAHHR